jgi:hypothetical protein
VLARGGWAGGRSECVTVVEDVRVCVRDRLTSRREVALVALPGKACAAASAKTPVRTTLPEISQRFSLWS